MADSSDERGGASGSSTAREVGEIADHAGQAAKTVESVARAAGADEVASAAHTAGQVAEAASKVAKAVDGGVGAARTMQHDPVGGLLGLAGNTAQALGGAGALGGADSKLSQAASKASQAVSALSDAKKALGGSSSSSSSSSSSPATTTASATGLSEQASWIFGSRDTLHTHYGFESKADGGMGWRVRHVTLEERLDTPYEAVIDLTNDDTSVDPLALLGQPATLTIERHTRRDVHGVIRRVERGGSGGSDRTIGVRVHLVPALWTLSQGKNSRIFQEKTVPEILKEVLEAGLGALQRELSLELQASYSPREYCVQWEESDLDFCRRLMQEEGIWYRFEHEAEAEKLILADSSTSFVDLETQDGNPVSFSQLSQGSAPLESMLRFRSTRSLVSNAMTVRDYDWTRPKVDFTGEANLMGDDDAASPDAPKMESYVHAPAIHFAQYDGSSFQAHDATKQAGLLRARHRIEIEYAAGESELTLASPGQWLELVGHPDAELDRKWLIVSVRHEGSGPAEAGSEAGGVEYVNRLELVPSDIEWRPLRSAWKRRVSSVVTATVVGPSGEEIFTDEHGRIKVQFHWDREGENDEHSSCFIRSMQPWGGHQWGVMFLPRIGMEVVVSFVGGDIDRPLVIGSVYNGMNMPPYALPDHKTRSTIKTNSSPGGDGFNELRFEDAAGNEEIYIHAQKDMNEQVLNNHSRSVGAEETISVGGNRTKSVDKNETITIKGSQKITIQGSGTGKGQTIQGGQLDITGKYKLDASDEIMVQAPNKITLTCGGSTLTMEPGKITMTSGGNATVVLDANALMKASGGGTAFLDANAFVKGNGGGQLLLDGNCALTSNAKSTVVLDANAAIQGSPGGKAVFDANALVQGGTATLDGKTSATVQAATSTLQGGAGSVEASGSGVNAAGPSISIAGAGSTSISGAVVKIN